MKSACRSIASRTSSLLIVIPDGMATVSSDRHERAPAMALEGENHAEREYKRHYQIEKAEDEQRRHNIGLGRVGHSLEERDFQDPQASRRVADERERERDEKNAEHGEEAGIGLRRQGEEDDAGGADELQRACEQLARRDRRAWINQHEVADLNRAEVQERADDEQARREDKHRPARLAEPFRSARQTFDKLGAEEEEKAAQRHGSEREGERAERDEQADLAAAEPLGRIGAIAEAVKEVSATNRQLTRRLRCMSAIRSYQASAV